MIIPIILSSILLIYLVPGKLKLLSLILAFLPYLSFTYINQTEYDTRQVAELFCSEFAGVGIVGNNTPYIHDAIMLLPGADQKDISAYESELIKGGYNIYSDQSDVNVILSGRGQIFERRFLIDQDSNNVISKYIGVLILDSYADSGSITYKCDIGKLHPQLYEVKNDNTKSWIVRKVEYVEHSLRVKVVGIR